MSHAHFVAEIVRASPSGYNRDLQEAKEPFLDGFELTIRSLRILAPLMAGLEVDEAALRAAFTPDVFATDRALELVAAGRPFRDAYHEVKAHLDQLAGQSPDEALAAKNHLGAPLGLDLAGMDAAARQVESWVAGEKKLHAACRDRLLGLKSKKKARTG